LGTLISASGSSNAQTLLLGSATGTDKTITLPNATGTIALTNDARFTDSRTPTSHTHGNITNAGAVPQNGSWSLSGISPQGTGYTNGSATINGVSVTIGVNAQGGVLTINSALLSSIPIGTYPIVQGSNTSAQAIFSPSFVANLPLITTTSGVVTTGTFGTTTNTFCQGNDVRLGSQTIFTLGGEEKTSFATSTSYYYGGQTTKASRVIAAVFDGGIPTLGLRVLGNWTIKAIAVHENLASSTGAGGVSTGTRTYKLVNLQSGSAITDLVSNITITNGALFNVITLEGQSVNISSGANLSLVLTTGSNGLFPTSGGTTTITASVYCVPR